MAQLAALLSDVSSDVQRVPDVSVERELRRAAIEFFSQSCVWQGLAEPITLKVGQQTYDLESAESQARVLRPVGEVGYIAQRKIPIRPYQDVFFKPTADNSAVLVIGTQPSGNTILVWPPPSTSAVAETLILNAIYVPTRTAVSIPDRLLDCWQDDIVAGAKWRLMRRPGQPWSDATGAATYKRLFYRGIARASRERVRSGGAPSRVRLRPFV